MAEEERKDHPSVRPTGYSIVSVGKYGTDAVECHPEALGNDVECILEEYGTDTPLIILPIVFREPEDQRSREESQAILLGELLTALGVPMTLVRTD